MSSSQATPTSGLDAPLYEARKKVQPAAVQGRLRSIKWIVLVVTLGVYYLLPFVRWDRGPHEPSQAVLVELAKSRFYFFFIELWPQDIYVFAGLLILAAFTLFLMNAVAGRVWCGYLCPQTVWTDLFLAVERLIEGDRRDRIKLDAAPWSAEKVVRRATKHVLWLAIAWWTGGAWVLYFADAPTLILDLATFQAPLAAYASIGVLTFTTYALAGWMREQVCTFMCPWPRIQGALTDKHSLAVTYRYDRGEPRGSAKKNSALRAAGELAGDCVDCNQCVVVCPTGVDIREGLQLGCIQCGLCIDACDNVMSKLRRPTALIGYDTDENCQRRSEGLAPQYRIVRARTILYGLLVLGVGLGILAALSMRSFTGLSALHDRNPLHVQLSDGSIRNGYTLRILNKRSYARRFRISVEGLSGARLEIVGVTDGDAIPVESDDTKELRALLFSPRGARPEKSQPILFRIVDVASGESASAHDFFRAP
ncbi:cytochrome c oxidase accessory protein CcoG [Terrarubrum flagellatum]|uniref:cytochrome c oxidase accessory protein CcoG n=1 Tax=Terrirubrum flagellatum TaxID=2895980 RepID=UPI0031454848